MICVYCPCNKEMVDEQEVDASDMSEGPDGADILTFTCPFCGEQHKSKRFGRR